MRITNWSSGSLDRMILFIPQNSVEFEWRDEATFWGFAIVEKLIWRIRMEEEGCVFIPP